jgi:hypothetical protein
VLAVECRSNAGDILEETLLPIAVTFAGRRWRRSGSALHRQVARALAQIGPHLAPVADSFARSRIEAIAERHRESAGARAARRRAMSGSLASAAKALVQPGLFGRSAMRADKVPVPACLLDEPSPASEDEQRIVWQTSLVAVICGSMP